MTPNHTHDPVVIVGYDGSERGGDALALGSDIAHLLGGRVLIAGVYRRDNPQWPGSIEYEQALRALVVEGLRQVDLDALDVPAKTRAVRGVSEAQGLHRLAESVGADLIVVGSTHRGAVGRVVAGTTAQKLLHEAPCAVAVAPLGYGTRRERPHIDRIVAGWDRSPESGDAVELGAALAARAFATLEVVTVVEPQFHAYADPMSGAVVAADAVHLAEQTATEALETLRHELPGSLMVDTQVRLGPAATELVDASDGADLVVLGSRGYGPVGRLVAGSVSSAVTSRVSCPVLIVARAAAGPSHEPALHALAGSEA